MKTLHLIRHFKSNWDNPYNADFDRTLNDRGISDIPIMASKMRAIQLKPDRVFYSAARRTTLSCEGLMRELQWPKDVAIGVASLYEISLNPLLEFIRALDDVWDEVAIIAHNPTMTDAINALCPVRLDNLPTGGWAQIELPSTKWQNAGITEARLVRLEYPKKRG
jgi:phosphohistidine phosphatase